MLVMIELAHDEVLVALKRPEDYEEVHPEMLAEDAIGDRWPYRTIHGDELAMMEHTENALEEAEYLLMEAQPTSDCAYTDWFEARRRWRASLTYNAQVQARAGRSGAES